MSTIDQDWERYWRAPDGEEPAALRAQIAALEAENARLRERNAQLAGRDMAALLNRAARVMAAGAQPETAAP